MIDLFHRQAVYFDFFDQLANQVVACAQRLRRLAAEFPESRAEIEHIHDQEHAADELTHAVLARMERSTFAPIDTHDIHTLVAEMDDVIDAMDDAADRFDVYQVDRVQPAFVRQSEVLASATQRVSEAVHALRTTRKLSDLKPVLTDVHHLERAGDAVHESALSELFGGKPDALFALKWKELYGLAEHAINLCEDVANTVERIAIKNA